MTATPTRSPSHGSTSSLKVTPSPLPLSSSSFWIFAPRVVGAQDLLQRAFEVAADLAVGAHDALDVDGGAGGDQRGRIVAAPAAAGGAAAGGDRGAQREHQGQDEQARWSSSPRIVGDRSGAGAGRWTGIPPRPTARHTPRTEAARATARTRAERRSRTPSCTGSPPAPHGLPPRKPCFLALSGAVRWSMRGHLWEEMCKLGCVVGESGVERRHRTGVEGLLPLLHLGPQPLLATRAPTRTRMAFRGTFDYTPRREEPAHGPGQVPGLARRTGVVLAKGIERCVAGLDARAASRPTSRPRSQGVHPLSAEARKLTALLQRQLVRHRARRRRPRDGPGLPARARRRCARRSSSPAPATASRSGTAAPGRDYNAALADDAPRHHRRLRPCWLT